MNHKKELFRGQWEALTMEMKSLPSLRLARTVINTGPFEEASVTSTTCNRQGISKV